MKKQDIVSQATGRLEIKGAGITAHLRHVSDTGRAFISWRATGALKDGTVISAGWTTDGNVLVGALTKLQPAFVHGSVSRGVVKADFSGLPVGEPTEIDGRQAGVKIVDVPVSGVELQNLAVQAVAAIGE